MANFGIRDLHAINQGIFCSIALFQRAGRLNRDQQSEMRLVEIGGGYGMLAHIMGIINKRSNICIIDLVEASSIQLYFSICMQEHIDTRIFAFYPDNKDPVEITQLSLGSSDESTCITIMPSQGIFSEKISRTIREADAILNFDSFMEMPNSEISKYFDLINGIKEGGLFIGRNRYKKVSKLIDYPFDNNWNIKYSHSSLLMPWHHELVTERIKEENAFKAKFQKRIKMYDEQWHNKGNAITNAQIRNLGDIS